MNMIKNLLSFAAAAVVSFLAVSSPAFGQDDLATKYPVSFNYDGQAFDPETWKSTRKDIDAQSFCVTYTSPDSKLALKVTYKQYSDYPVYEVRPTLECLSDTPTAIVENFKFLDYVTECPSSRVKIRRMTGSMSYGSDFVRHDVLMHQRFECCELSMSQLEGKGSAWLPYLGVDYDPLNGVEVAVGWTGAWKADVTYYEDLNFSVSLDKTYFKMLPGEVFRMPYTVIYERHDKSVDDGLAEFHRFIIKYKTPRDASGKIFEPLLPLTASGGNKTDENMLMVLDKATRTFPDIPFNAFWVDAGWYGEPHEVTQDSNCGPFWYKWAGLWKPNTWSHPEGNMMKVAKAAEEKGMRFLLWFEPERATIHSPAVQQHPEWFHRDRSEPDEAYLLDLGNDEARAWIVEEVSRNIRESGVKIYRQDFNMDPLSVWRANDEPDRQGVMEIKHINGLYAFWDELHRRFPDMMFENCSGGGRRMDIEMMSRSHSYCRDDAHMFPGMDDMTQNITLNSTAYIPFTGGETFACPIFDTYSWLSHMAAGTVFTPTDFDGMFLRREPDQKEIDWFTKMLTVSNRVRPLFFGDFYPLTHEAFDSPAIYCGYQLDEKESGKGFFIIFRRDQCQESEFELRLKDIDPKATYIVEQFEGKTKKMKGCDLARQTLTFNEPRSYKLFFYSKKK